MSRVDQYRITPDAVVETIYKMTLLFKARTIKELRDNTDIQNNKAHYVFRLHMIEMNEKLNATYN